MNKNVDFVEKQIVQMDAMRLVNLTNDILKMIGKSHRKIRPNRPSNIVNHFETVEDVVQAMMDTDKYRTTNKFLYYHPRKVLNSSNSAYEAMNAVLGSERLIMAMFKNPDLAKEYGIVIPKKESE